MSGHFWGAALVIAASALGWGVWFCAVEPSWRVETQLRDVVVCDGGAE